MKVVGHVGGERIALSESHLDYVLPRMLGVDLDVSDEHRYAVAGESNSDEADCRLVFARVREKQANRGRFPDSRARVQQCLLKLRRSGRRGRDAPGYEGRGALPHTPPTARVGRARRRIQATLHGNTEALSRPMPCQSRSRGTGRDVRDWIRVIARAADNYQPNPHLAAR